MILFCVVCKLSCAVKIYALYQYENKMVISKASCRQNGKADLRFFYVPSFLLESSAILTHPFDSTSAQMFFPHKSK